MLALLGEPCTAVTTAVASLEHVSRSVRVASVSVSALVLFQYKTASPVVFWLLVAPLGPSQLHRAFLWV